MKGMVAADMTMDGDTVLTRLETFERHVLRGRWSLVTSDDSDHVFVAKDGSDDVSEFHDVEDIFARQLFEDDEGQRYLLRLRDAVRNPQPMAALMSRHRVGRITLHVGTTSASVCFQVYVFIRPRPGNARIVWPLQDVYSFLGTPLYNGTPSKWVCKHWAVWSARLAEACGSSQLVAGTYLAKDNVTKLRMPFEWRCLPTPSASTFGLLYLATMWSSCTPQRGGLRDAVARLNAATLLRAMWSWAPAHGQWTLRTQASPEWVIRWARLEPLPGADGWVELQIDAGCCSLAPLRAFEDTWEHGVCVKGWIKALEPLVDVESELIPVGCLV